LDTEHNLLSGKKADKNLKQQFCTDDNSALI
jgi:hypothetical protein